MSDLASAARKRARDRRAQQTLRDKKLRYTAKLEMQVAHCEQYHDEKGVQHLRELVEDLRKQNEALVARQKALRALVSSWDEELEVTGSSNPSMTQNMSNGEFDLSLPMTHSVLREAIVDHPTAPNIPLTSATSTSPQGPTDRLRFTLE
jgi:predicted  nucleic acid-binding Zn-ribbon protein